MSEQDSTTSASSNSSSLGLSSCMGGKFDPLKGDTSNGNQWKFCFDKSNNEVHLDVTINTPTMLVDINNQHLTTSFGLEDIQQLVIWLFQVKSTIQRAEEEANDTEQSGGSSTADGAEQSDSASTAGGK